MQTCLLTTQVRVRLTLGGQAVLYNYRTHRPERHAATSTTPLPPGHYQGELQELMYIFGPACCEPGRTLFVDDEIVFVTDEPIATADPSKPWPFWSFTCDSCAFPIKAIVADVMSGWFGVAYGGENKQLGYFVPCPNCGHNHIVPRDKLTDKIRAEATPYVGRDRDQAGS